MRLPPNTITVTPNAIDWYAVTDAYRLVVKYTKDKHGQYWRIRKGYNEPNRVGVFWTKVCPQHIETMAREEVFGSSNPILIEPTDPNKIIHTVCQMNGTDLNAVRSKSRGYPVSRARGICAYILHFRLQMSYPEIANMLRTDAENRAAHSGVRESALRVKRGVYGDAERMADEIIEIVNDSQPLELV
jgi:hypothetical protein